jgi:hypothetical protein
VSTEGIYLRDELVLEVLRADLEIIGAGVSRGEIERVGGTIHPDRLIGRLRLAGCVIEETADRFRLFAEPGSTETSGEALPPAGSSWPGVSVALGSDALFPDSMTLGEARGKLLELVGEGHQCPTCAQHAQVYRRPLHAAIARALILMHNAAGTSFAHKPTVLKGIGSASRDESIARFWGLIQEDPERAGYWRVTDRGAMFVHGDVKVPHYAVIYAGRCLRLEGAEVSIFDCLGRKFSHAELMREAAA